MYQSTVSFGGRATTLVGKIFTTIFGAVFLLAGLGFTWLIVNEVQSEAALYWWKPTPCTILVSRVKAQGEMEANGNREKPFGVELRYRYQGPDSRERISDRYKLRAGNFFRKISEANAVVRLFPQGAVVTCYVDPANPANAVLARANPLLALLVLFPLIFLAVGGGVIYFAWRTPRETPLRPVERSSAGKAWAIPIFFSVFLIVGAVSTWLTLARPFLQIRAARDWPEVPCLVLASEVRPHSDSDGTTYSIEIRYAYNYSGQHYESDQYSFAVGSSSGTQSKFAVVRQYPKGKHTVCYVNPAEPTVAVLHRSWEATMWFGLIPLVFVAVGAGGMFHGFRVMARGRAVPGMGLLQPGGFGIDSSATSTQPQLLKPDGTRLGKLIGVTFFAVFWCGLTSIFVTMAVKSWHTDSPEYFLTVFITPFVLIGLGSLLAIPYQFLALWNPQLEMTVSSQAVPLGGDLHLQWRLTGRTEKVQRLRILLEGQEEATYRRGTSTTTDRKLFLQTVVFESTDAEKMRAGATSLVIPENGMHTFTAQHNKILWSLRVQGEIPRWPDVRELYGITVLPLRAARAAAPARR